MALARRSPPGPTVNAELTAKGIERPALILAYHVLGVVPRHLDPENLIVEPKVFQRQIRALKRRRYRFATVSEYANQLRDRQKIGKLCVLTFDDGTADGLTILAPLLDEMGICATLYISPGLLGQPHPDIERAADVRILTQAELIEVAKRPNIEIGSHTRFHTTLEDASFEQALEEMSTSKIELEQLINRPVTTFAYPSCSYSAACPPAAKQAGYLAAVTCEGHGGARMYELSRESINSRDGRLRFALKIHGLFAPVAKARKALRRRR